MSSVDPMMESIDALRGRLRKERRALPAPIRIAAAERTADHLLGLASMPTHGYIAGYWAIDGEVSLHAFLLRMPKTLTYCLPVVQPDRVMRFVAWKPGDAVAPNRFGIPEPVFTDDQLLQPQEMEFVVTPLVAFDAGCQRIGMGGGWYDRTFAFRQASVPPMVGVGYALQQVDTIVAQPWDVRMDAICTEQATILSQASADR